jgi:23S rRNA (pseudouridine1915-N3)-methyltransferase
MRITLLTIGKTEDQYLKEGIDKYLKRLKHYTSFQILELPDLKNTKSLSEEQQKSKEAELIFKQISPSDCVVLLDERGPELSSIEFSYFLNKKALGSIQHLVFVTGGPYGFDAAIYDRANDRLSLSKMTFSHQMVRLFFVEQLYRAFTILKAEPYHHA